MQFTLAQPRSCHMTRTCGDDSRNLQRRVDFYTRSPEGYMTTAVPTRSAADGRSVAARDELAQVESLMRRRQGETLCSSLLVRENAMA